jgi:D-alanyl-D-alanine carboxypeptidase
MRDMRALLWTLGLLLPLTGSAADSWAPAKRLDAWFDQLAKEQRVNGSIAISEKGWLRYQRSVGFARIENGVPQPGDAGTRYRIGPVSRIFTAALTMQVVEKASITLDSPVAEFYPDLPNALAITYRDLLQDRSGLADYFDAADFPAWHTQPRTHEQMLAAITAGGVKFAPRERVEPSNSNYLLLGYVLEKVQGRSYDDILRRGIDKLGLARTYFAGTQRSTLESIAYRESPEGWIAIDASDPTVLGGAAGVLSNAGDLVKFMDALFAEKLLSAQSLATLRGTEGAPRVALQSQEIAGQAAEGLQGSADGFSAAVYYFPARQLSISFTGNASAVPAIQIVEQALTTVIRRGYKPRKSRRQDD